MLYKKELLTIPYIKFVREPGRPSQNISYYAFSQVTELQKSGKILVVDYYKPDTDIPCIRFFADSKSKTFLTYKTETKKFVTSMLARALVEADKQYNFNVVDSDKTRKTAMDYLNVYSDSFITWTLSPSSFHGITGTCESFCQQIRDEKRVKSQNSYNARQLSYDCQFLDSVDDFNEYKKRSKAWGKWVATRFNHEYLFFSNIDKSRYRECYCTGCQRRFKVKDEGSVKHKNEGICPKCGKRIIYWAERFAYSINEKLPNGALFIDVNKKYEIFIYADVKRSYNEALKPIYGYYEYIHCLRIKAKDKLVSSSYTSGGYYYGKHWSYFKSWTPSRCVNICPDNIEKLENIPEYVQPLIANADYPIDLFHFLELVRKYPSCEYICKMGLTKFVSAIPRFWAQENYVNLKGMDFQSFMGVTKQYLPMYRNMDVSYFEHKIIKNAKEYIHSDDVEALRSLKITDHSIYDEAIIELLQRMSLKKLCNYLNKQFEVRRKAQGGNGLTINNDYRVIIELRDFYNLCIALGINLNRKNMFPTDIHKEHNILVDRYNKIKKKEERESSRAALALVNEFFTGYSDKNFTVLVPHEKADFVKEGQELSHCVGTGSYYQNHIKGTKMIFFIRKIEEPDIAYFTAEIDMSLGTVKQLYGYGDCKAPNDVAKFVKKFAEWLLKEKRKQMRKAG